MTQRAQRQAVDGRVAQVRVRESLTYDPRTGVLRWRVDRTCTARAGTRAGCSHSRGYLTIRVDGHRYYAHRLAWLLALGEWPAGEIDHIDGDTGNNRLANLRVVTRSQNNLNHNLHRNNTSGVSGVYWYAARSKWRAIIKIRGKKKHLGLFASRDEAEAARRTAAVALVGGPIREGQNRRRRVTDAPP
jgi:hypothetical protein